MLNWAENMARMTTNVRDIKYSEYWRTADRDLIREDDSLDTVETGERSFETNMMLRFLSRGRS
jgi:hypothetical protein